MRFFLIGFFLFSIYFGLVFSETNKKKDCGPTTSDQLGPYYISGVPENNNLLGNDKSKDKKNLVNLKGKVMTSFTKEAIPNAKIEIWQAGAKGDYWPENNGKYLDYQPEEIKFRGTTFSNPEGEFFFTTFIPGAYGNRPRHYHLKVTANNFKPLITQYYLKENESDERKIARDFSARRAEVCRILELKPGVNEPTLNLEIQLVNQ